jgi:hypothetical protein
MSQQTRLENTNVPKQRKNYADTVSGNNANTFFPNFNDTSSNATDQPAQSSEEVTILQIPKNIRSAGIELPAQENSEEITVQNEEELPLPKNKNKRKLNPDSINDDDEQEQIVKKLLEDDNLSHSTENIDSDSESIKSNDSFDSTATVNSTASESAKIRTKKIVEKGNKIIDQFIAKVKPKSHYPLSNKKFVEFLKQSYGCKPHQVLAVIKEFTEDQKGIKTMIEDNIHKVSNFNLKRRLSRIAKVIDEETK